MFMAPKPKLHVAALSADGGAASSSRPSAMASQRSARQQTQTPKRSSHRGSSKRKEKPKSIAEEEGISPDSEQMNTIAALKLEIERLATENENLYYGSPDAAAASTGACEEASGGMILISSDAEERAAHDEAEIAELGREVDWYRSELESERRESAKLLEEARKRAAENEERALEEGTRLRKQVAELESEIDAQREELERMRVRSSGGAASRGAMDSGCAPPVEVSDAGGHEGAGAQVPGSGSGMPPGVGSAVIAELRREIERLRGGEAFAKVEELEAEVEELKEEIERLGRLNREQRKASEQ